VNGVDRLLTDAGARWREGQPPGPTIAVGEVIDDLDRRGGFRFVGRNVVGLIAAGVIVSLLAAWTLGRLTPSGSVGGLGPTPSAGVAATGGSAPPASSPSAGTSPSSAVACPITSPAEPAFTPPRPFLPVPPASYRADWYGTAHLFTMVDRVPTPKGPWLSADAPLPDKTFWWSADWVPRNELEPAITVTGRRLDGFGTFTFGNPGTNASADFGTAMLVGIDYPSVGCWELTARYRQATLSIVVEVID
jgi:hypothetical protein